MSLDTGISYFSKIFDAYSNLYVDYSFQNTSGVTVFNDSSTIFPQYSGNLQFLDSTFTSKGGYATLIGDNYITPSNTQDFSAYNNYTMIFAYQPTQVGGTLFSSYSTGYYLYYTGYNQNYNTGVFFGTGLLNNSGDGQNGYVTGYSTSGFILGLNDNNKIYIQSYNQNGPYLWQSSNSYANKNAIGLTKSNNRLSLSYYNFDTQSLETEYCPIDSKYFLNSNNWSIGGGTSQFLTLPFVDSRNFNGLLDTFAYYNTALLPYQLKGIMSGIYTNILTPTSYTLSYNYNEITGYYSGQNPIFTGITGQTNDLVGYLSNCNNIFPVYQISGKTGVIYDNYLYPLTESVNIIYGTGYSRFYSVNSGYSLSYGMSGVSFLKQITGKSEVYTFESDYTKPNINTALNYSTMNQGFVNNPSGNLSTINFYNSGVALLGSGVSVNGGYYNTQVILYGDYAIVGNLLSGNFNGSINICDYISGNRNNHTIITSGFSGMILDIQNGLPPSAYFLNGTKLISGIDYTLTGNNFYGNCINNITGKIFTFPLDINTSHYTGNHTYYKSTYPFCRDSSTVYLNGQRQINGIDYLEVSSFDLLNNTSNYVSIQSGIYKDTNDYIENL